VAVRKLASVNQALTSQGGIYDEQGRQWHLNQYENGSVTGSLIGDGRYSHGSRCELDLHICISFTCADALNPGDEVVFRTDPMPLWNANSVLPGGGAVGAEWVADNIAGAINHATGYKWSSQTPLLVEDSFKFPHSAKILGNMVAAMVPESGYAGTPGQLYAFGGFRVFGAIDGEPIAFAGHMRIGFTRA
jgi:hypothetical protein